MKERDLESEAMVIVGGWGGESFCDPNREIDFGFGFVSCVTCVRAGEAKLRGRVRRRFPSVARAG